MPRPMIARLTTTAALTALALATLPAAAQTAAEPGTAAGEAGPMMTPFADVDVAPLVFDALDTDGDGVISPEELEAAVAELDPRAQAALVRTLVDDDARRLAMAEAMVARLDTDGDGVLSAEEIAAGMAERAEARAAWRAEMQERRAERGKSGWRDDRRGERMERQERRESPRGRGDGPRN